MMRIVPAALLAVFLAVPALANDPADPYAPQIAPVVSLTPGVDAAIEGEVRTVWPTSFLLADRSGEVVVDVSPKTTEELGIDPRAVVQVAGKLVDSRFRPLVVTTPRRGSVMFSGTDVYEPLSQELVDHNTRVWTIPPGTIAKLSGTSANGGSGDRTSSDVSATLRQQ